MGEVYRATDARLNRDVALKILPEAFATDRERMARFEREAQLLASLNHPHIAAIYGIEEAAGVRCLVLELVDGETLADRLERGPLPLQDALDLARQVAEALEAAHEKGIIHRDLKPANIKITPDGLVKVLDFGLAKGLAPGGVSDPAFSPTISIHATEAGVLLGTAAYMSPEQARGRPLDKRTDIWSFGCVLFETLSGQGPFGQGTITDTLAAIVRGDPDWSLLPADTPSRVRVLLERCLQKDRKLRLRDIGDAKLELVDAVHRPEQAMPAKIVPRRPAWLAWSLVAALAIALVVLGWMLTSQQPPDTRVVRFTIAPPAGTTFGDESRSVIALSPDGRQLVMALQGGATRRLYLRRFDESEGRALDGSDHGEGPTFSPDGRWILFDAGKRLKRVPVDGGQPQTIAKTDGWFGGTMTDDGRIILTPTYTAGLAELPASGALRRLTTPDTKRKELGHFWPQLLPDGETVLATAFTAPLEGSRLITYSLRDGSLKPLIEHANYGRYVSTGHVLFIRGNSVMAVACDLDRLQISGEPIPVIDDVAISTPTGLGHFAVSDNGSLAYLRASETVGRNRFVWIDRQGKKTLFNNEAGSFGQPTLSPDGRRLMFVGSTETDDVWFMDLERGTSTRLTHDPVAEFNARWTPDGRHVIYSLERPVYDIYVKPADGSAAGTPVIESEFDKHLNSLSPDGHVIAYTESHPVTGNDIWTLKWTERGARPSPFRRTPFVEEMATFSPDGRWIAYHSNESGRQQVYVQPYPGSGSQMQISTDGGYRPVWGKNGRELFYRNGLAMMSVPITLAPTLRAGHPVKLFEAELQGGYTFIHPGYDVAGDGRFIALERDPAAPRPVVHVVLNWLEELKKKMQ